MRGLIALAVIFLCCTLVPSVAAEHRPSSDSLIKIITDTTHALIREPQKSSLLSSTSKADDPSCQLCMSLAAPLSKIILMNNTKADLQALVIYMCEAFKVECTSPATCKEVCTGVVSSYTDEVLEIASKSVLQPATFCAILKVCPAPPPPPVYPPYVPVPSNLSDTTGERVWPSWSQTGSGYFIQLSDIHLDLLYSVGATNNCGKPVCCRAEDGMGNGTTSAGYWGDFNNCDTPIQTLKSLASHIGSLNPPPDFILYTGDDPAHDLWLQSRETNINAINAISELFATMLPNIPMYPAVGNHEAYPVNQFEGPGGDDWLNNALVNAWKPWLPADALKTLAYGGYYQARLRPGLRVISLNTNYYADDDYWLMLNNTDFSSQLTWLVDVLEQAQKLNEKVILIGHAYPLSWMDVFAEQFASIVAKYSHVIMNIFYGHTHTSSVIQFRNGANEPVVTGYVGGSLTPYSFLNPGYRLFHYDRALNTSELVTNYEGHWMDLLASNLNQTEPDWTTVRLSARDAYQMTDLTPASWDKVLQRMLADIATYKTYIYGYYKGYDQRQPDSETALACQALSSTKALFNACMQQHKLAAVLPKDRCSAHPQQTVAKE